MLQPGVLRWRLSALWAVLLTLVGVSLIELFSRAVLQLPGLIALLIAGPDDCSGHRPIARREELG